MGGIKKLGILYTSHNFCWEDGFRPKVVTDFTMNTNFVMNCMGGNKKVGLLYTSQKFRRENAWGEERWWFVYISAPLL